MKQGKPKQLNRVAQALGFFATSAMRAANKAFELATTSKLKAPNQIGPGQKNYHKRIKRTDNPADYARGPKIVPIRVQSQEGNWLTLGRMRKDIEREERKARWAKVMGR